jgi:hypothetical protein
MNGREKYKIVPRVRHTHHMAYITQSKANHLIGQDARHISKTK